MGNPNSKTSLQKPSSLNNTVNFVRSSGDINSSDISHKNSEVFAKFTWNYGGNQVLLTGEFYGWKKSIPLQKHGDEFSINIQLPKGIYQYKFIVDGEWRFSPEDPTIPDPNGNINNVIDTTKFQPLVSIKNPTLGPSHKDEGTDQEGSFQGVEEFAKNAPKLPPHYDSCSYLTSMPYNPGATLPTVSSPPSSSMRDESRSLEEELSEAEIMELFDSPHSLAPPYHVEVDHLICQSKSQNPCFSLTQRFKNKYTTYRYFMAPPN